MVHSTAGIVQIGVGGVEGYPMLQGKHHAALLPTEVAHLTQRAENQRMVRHNHLSVAPDCLTDDFFGDVQRDYHPSYRRVGKSDLKSGVVIFFLQAQRGNALYRLHYF